MDFIAGLVLSVLRDLLFQGAGTIIVNSVSKGRVVPDAWSANDNEPTAVQDSWFTYTDRGQRHVYSWVVFCIGAIFWVCIGVAIYALASVA
jgi:hypothetical protein